MYSGHVFGSLQNTLQILSIQQKNLYLNILEIFCIYKTTKNVSTRTFTLTSVIQHTDC
jgi:hypothetical protein